MANISPRKCKICGKEFTPNSCRQYYCKELHYRICPVCGKSYPEPNLDKFKSEPTTCSMECRVKKREQTSMQKYGIKVPGNNPTAREKSKQTMQERYGVDYAQKSQSIRQKSINTWINQYGVDNPQKVEDIKNKTAHTNIEKYGSKSYLSSQRGKEQIDTIMMEKYGTTVPLKNPEIKQKCIKTNIERYGVSNPLENKDVRQKCKDTSLERYGVEYPMSSDIVKQRVKDTFLRNYGLDNCSKSAEIIEKIKKSFFEHYGVHSVMEVKEISDRIKATNMKKYGVPYYVMLPDVALSSGRISKINRSFANKLSEKGIHCSFEHTIGTESYDISIHQGNMLIEINPSYTHNTIGNRWNPKGIDKNYHLKKTILATESGYRCMHLWDWDDTSKFINLLTTKNIIYRKIKPEIVSDKEAKDFISKYSLYSIPDSLRRTIFIGLRYKTKLITLMGFELTDFITNTWTLICIEQRFQYTVYKGTQTILDNFMHLFNPKRIIAYADFSKTNGEILENLDFEYNRFIMPNRIWSKGRHAIVDSPSIIAEAMIEDKWLPVYNCGYKVYEKVFPKNKSMLDD